VDAAFRYGGDEFVLLLPETGTVGAARVARRVYKAVQLTLGKEGVSTSWGAAELDESGDLASLVRRADAAMYKMKAGRDNVRMRGTAIARAFKPSTRV